MDQAANLKILHIGFIVSFTVFAHMHRVGTVSQSVTIVVEHRHVLNQSRLLTCSHITRSDAGSEG